MIVAVGTKNPAKLAAVADTIKHYGFLRGSAMRSFDVASGVSAQPRGLSEIAIGATNRAARARELAHEAYPSHSNPLWGIGIESGVFEFPFSKTMDTCCCCVTYNGVDCHYGLSPSFELPPSITDLVDQGRDLNQAFFEVGVTTDPRIGDGLGALGLLTAGRIDRSTHCKQAVMMALIAFENSYLYGRR